MIIPLTTETVMFSVAIGTAVFAAYRTFKDPDILADKDIALHELRIKAVENAVLKIGTNDIPHIDAKIDAMMKAGAEHDRSVAENFARVFTILDERVPRK